MITSIEGNPYILARDKRRALKNPETKKKQRTGTYHLLPHIESKLKHPEFFIVAFFHISAASI